MVSRILLTLAFTLCALNWFSDAAVGNPLTIAHVLIPGLVQVCCSGSVHFLSLPVSRSGHCWPSPCYAMVSGLLIAPAQAFLQPSSARLSLTSLPDSAFAFPFIMGKPLIRLPASPAQPLCLAHFAMPRERPHMGCRRGSARGRATRRRSPTSSDPTSEALDFRSFRTPVTRGSRSRGIGLDRIQVGEHHSQLHSARFRIPCSLGNATFIVSVAIELVENVVGSEDALQAAPPVNSRENPSNLQQMSLERPIASHTANKGREAPSGDIPSTSAAHSSVSIDSDHYGCRIVEEDPMTSNED